MEKHCNICHSNDIDELLWINQITGEVGMREDQYFCRHCNAKVDVILTAPAVSWVEDIEPLQDCCICNGSGTHGPDIGDMCPNCKGSGVESKRPLPTTE